MAAVAIPLGGNGGSGASGQEAGAPAGSSPEAVAVYTDAANFQNNGEYELAAQEWQKFVTQFPDDPLATSAQHYVGVCLLQQKKTAEAAKAFAAVIARGQPFDALDETYLNLGWCQYKLGAQGDQGQLEQAVRTLQQFRERFPDSKLADQGLFYLGESLYLQGRRQEAVVLYQALIDGHKRSPLRADALYALGVAQQEAGQADGARATFDRFLQELPKHALVPEVQLRKAETLVTAGQFQQAEALFAQVAAIPGFDSADVALFRQAYSAAKQERHEDAARLYAALVERFPQSVLVSDSIMSSGRAWYRAGKFAEAAAWFRRVVEDPGPDSAEAAHWLARGLLQQGQPEQALAAADKGMSLAAGSDYLPQLKHDRADALYELPARRSEAIDAYLAVYRDHPQSEIAPQSLYNAAFAALALKQFDQAIEHARQFVDAYSEHTLRPDAEFVLAESQLMGGDPRAAEQVYARLLEKFPRHDSAANWQVRQAMATFLQGHDDRTIQLLGPSVAALPDGAVKAEAYYLLGVSQSRRGDLPAALAALESSLATGAVWADAADAMLALASVQTQSHQEDAARATLQKLLEQFPDDPRAPRARYQRAELEFAQQKFADAISWYEQLLQKSPDSDLVPSALYGKAWSQMKLGEHEAAETTLNELLERFSTHELAAKSLRARAYCRQLRGDFRQALADIDAFLKTDPQGDDLWDAWYLKGLCQVGVKQYADAVASFQRIVDSAPAYPRMDRVLYELGWALQSAGDRSQAAKWFAELAERFSESPLAGEALYHTAELHYDEQRHAEAAEAYQAARRKATADELREKATYKLGWAWYRQQQYDRALQVFQEQVQMFSAGPLATDGLFMMGECQFRKQDYEQALATFQQLQGREGLKDNAKILALLHAGQSANQLKRWSEAVEFFQAVIEQHADSPYRPQAQYELGWALQNQEQWEQAAAAYRAVVDSSRNAVGARAQFMLGELYFARKDFAKALTEFQRLMYGYGGQHAPENVKPWQAKGALEAGRCAAVLAGQARDVQQQTAYLERARKYFRHVLDHHAGTDEAQAAASQLERIGAS